MTAMTALQSVLVEDEAWVTEEVDAAAQLKKQAIVSKSRNCCLYGILSWVAWNISYQTHKEKVAAVFVTGNSEKFLIAADLSECRSE